MITVAVVSMKGGVGRTTVAANLGALLAQGAPDQILLVDFDPGNQVELHFDLPALEGAGLARATLRGLGWSRALHRRLDGFACLPFGEVGDEERGEFERRLGERPELLGERLEELSLASARVAVIDAAPGPSVYFQSVLPLADLAIVVAHADAASFATLPSLRAQLMRHRPLRPGPGGTYLLLNDVDEGRRLGRDVRVAFAAESDLPLLPFVVHRDEAVCEALACRRTVAEQAPSSQAAADLRRLAAWVREEIMALELSVVEQPRAAAATALTATAGGETES